MAHIVVEGSTDEVVLRRLLSFVGVEADRAFGLRGRQYVLRNLPRYNQAAQHFAFVALVDFDMESNCVGAFVNAHLQQPSPLMRFRVAVRAIESWLMADRTGLANFLAIRQGSVPDEPDGVGYPKVQMVNLARSSRRSAIKNAMVPRDGSGAAVGPGYSGTLIDFASSYWNVEQALQRSPSLNRSALAIATLAYQ